MLQIIPKPVKAKEKEGTFYWKAETSVSFDSCFRETKPFWAAQIQAVFGTPLQERENADIQFCFDAKQPKEGYRLSVQPTGIRVFASTHVGALYAIQTLRQIGQFDVQKTPTLVEIPAAEIVDYPRYAWRGQMLDCSRHFFSIAEIKRLLDLMLLHKLNVFHWHLTDDQGWRLEIKQFPLLTEIGSKRKDTQKSGWSQKKFELENKPCEGFYTQEEVRDVVEYARLRGIMIVPELDMPAHFAAAEAAYPYLACREIQSEVFWWCSAAIPEQALGYKDNSWNRPACLGKDSTYQFIFAVLDEVCDLFPAPYFHIGGDEAPTDEWEKCPVCQAKMREEGLSSPRALQGYFTNRVRAYLETKGKRIIGWNEVLDSPNLDRSVIGQYWTNTRSKAAERHVKNGGDIILSRHLAFYFDYPHCEVRLPYTYRFEPKRCGVRKKDENRVLGVEAELWTEFVPDVQKLDFNLFPRMAAVSETAWTPKKQKNFKDFAARLPRYIESLEALGVNYAPPAYILQKRHKTYARLMHAFYHNNPLLEMEEGMQFKAQKK